MVSGGPAVNPGYRPALDGLRGIAVLLVIATHAQIPRMSGGGTVGVTLFFVLSGFLITSILRQEHLRNGFINYRHFYARRLRRLLPAVNLLLIAVAAYLLFSGQSLIPVVIAGLYGSNFAAAAGRNLGNLAHTWSLSIEEQFYLLWPVLLPLVARRRPALILTLAAVASAALRTGLWLTGAPLARVANGTDVRADALLIGCALAFANIAVPRRLLGVSAAISAVFLVIACGFASATAFMSSLTPVTLASVTLVAWTLRSSPRILTWSPLVAVGKISYGLYLWNLPISLSLLSWDAPTWARSVVLVAASFAMACLSWYIIERPFTRRRALGAGAGLAVSTPLAGG